MLRSLFTLPLFTRLYATQVPLPHRFAMAAQREAAQERNSQYITERDSGQFKALSLIAEVNSSG